MLNDCVIEAEENEGDYHGDSRAYSRRTLIATAISTPNTTVASNCLPPDPSDDFPLLRPIDCDTTWNTESHPMYPTMKVG